MMPPPVSDDDSDLQVVGSAPALSKLSKKEFDRLCGDDPEFVQALVDRARTTKSTSAAPAVEEPSHKPVTRSARKPKRIAEDDIFASLPTKKRATTGKGVKKNVTTSSSGSGLIAKFAEDYMSDKSVHDDIKATLKRDDPCFLCVKSLVSGKGNGDCYDHNGAGERCYHCRSGKKCEPVPASLKLYADNLYDAIGNDKEFEKARGVWRKRMAAFHSGELSLETSANPAPTTAFSKALTAKEPASEPSFPSLARGGSEFSSVGFSSSRLQPREHKLTLCTPLPTFSTSALSEHRPRASLSGFNSAVDPSVSDGRLAKLGQMFARRMKRLQEDMLEDVANVYGD